MKYRRFGRTGWNVSEIGYGMWGMGGWSGSDDEAIARRRCSGRSISDAIFSTPRGRMARDTASSCWARCCARIAARLYTRRQRFRRRIVSGRASREFTLDDCYPPEYIEEYIDKSLANIGVPTLDLIQLHTWEDAWMEDDRWRACWRKLSRTEKCAPSASASIAGSRRTA